MTTFPAIAINLSGMHRCCLECIPTDHEGIVVAGEDGQRVRCELCGGVIQFVDGVWEVEPEEVAQ